MPAPAAETAATARDATESEKPLPPGGSLEQSFPEGISTKRGRVALLRRARPVADKGLDRICLQAQRVSRLRARPKGFPVALWKPSAPGLWETLRSKEIRCFIMRQIGGRVALLRRARPIVCKVFDRICLQALRVSRLRARPKGFPVALWNLRPFAANGNLHKMYLPCGRQRRSFPATQKSAAFLPPRFLAWYFNDFFRTTR